MRGTTPPDMPIPFDVSAYSGNEGGLPLCKPVMLTPKLVGVSRKMLGDRIGNLSGERRSIIAALDLLVTGI